MIIRPDLLPGVLPDKARAGRADAEVAMAGGRAPCTYFMHQASSIGIKTEIHGFSLKSSWYQHRSSTPYMPKNVSLLLVL